MTTFACSLAAAQQCVADFDTKDASSLAYVSSLVALETLLPELRVEEMEFTVELHADKSIVIDLPSDDIDPAIRDAINAVASHYFLARLNNIAVSVH